MIVHQFIELFSIALQDRLTINQNLVFFFFAQNSIFVEVLKGGLIFQKIKSRYL